MMSAQRVVTEYAMKTGSVTMTGVVLTMTARSSATVSVDLMEPAPTPSVALIPTVNMSTVSATFLPLMTVTSVTIVTMENVNQVVLTMVLAVQTVRTPTRHATAMCAAVPRMRNVITTTGNVT